MIKKASLAMLYCCFTCCIAHAQSSVEKQLVESVNQQLSQSQALLIEAVNINSGTQNFAGVKQVGMLFKQQYDALGFTTEWLDGSEFERAGHLVATYESATHPSAAKIMLIGHLDTVFAKDDSFQQATIINQNTIAGPGITDMKGGNVIMLAALQVLQQHGLLSAMNIKVVLTGDEEASGQPLAQSKQALIDAGIWADIALGFEDADGDINTAVTARRGSVAWTLTTTGQAAHSSQIFTEKVGFGANFELARILNAFREQLSDIPLLSFNPGVMAGGTRLKETAASTFESFGKSNVVAQTAMVKGGLRAVSPNQLTETKEKMQAIVAEHLPQTDASLVFDDGYPPMQQTQGNVDLLEMYSQVSTDLGFAKVTAVNPRNAGAADISFVSDHVTMAIDGLGLMGTGGHTKDETADMTSFAQNIQKTTVLLYRLSTQQQ
ncbi:M20/M25/M40 family metallo-hydrolase [Paraglaciecola sp.]|uniref:M20/M25/M40 family metallo-hydrolase n=1 Tax=Paraglaciecola sp. TaxID=1920173 RepID=UPI002740076D|nr:M20/M25/M40 family metallo-hydrolase [Paraglaciecola sp.]MDP5030022.1 M20/M25/M40 family metallo-hydrolase [Paraglaciecola sp.]